MKIPMNITLHQQTRRSRAFTLVEILLVVTIIGILAALVIPKIAGRGEQARMTAAQTDIKGGIKSAIDQFEVDTGSYPKTLQDLIQAPNDAHNWHGPYFDPPNLPVDPWQHPYVYVFPGRKNPNSYDLYSVGPDGQDGTADDIGNWQAGK
jgi:general secretion pathway protein G